MRRLRRAACVFPCAQRRERKGQQVERKAEVERIVRSFVALTLVVSLSAAPAFAAEASDGAEPTDSENAAVSVDSAGQPTDAAGGEAALCALNDAASEDGGDISAPISTQSEDDLIDSFEKLQTAVSAGGAVVLGSDVEIPKGEILDVQAEVDLDLNGKTLSKSDTDEAIQVLNGGSLVIGNGAVLANSTWMINVYDGSLTVESGTYTAGKYVLRAKGNSADSKAIVTVNGGSFSNKNESYIGYLSSYSESYIYGGEFVSDSGFAVMNQTKATVPVSGSLSTAPRYSYAAENYMLTSEEYAVPVKLVWGAPNSSEGPSLHVTSAGIFGNFWNSCTDVTINSGSIVSTGDSVIYQPQQGSFTMNGGYLQGESVIEAKMGHFTFNGGYAVAVGEAPEDSDYEDILGGTTANGAVMKIELGYYGARDNDGEIGARGPAPAQAGAGGSTHLPLDNDFSLDITGGVFISKNNAPFTVKNWNMCKQEASYSITGGRFSSFPKTIDMVHADGDPVNAYGVPVCNTVGSVGNYIFEGEYAWAPAAYYDGVGLDYGFAAADAPYYASMADAIADRNNDAYARAYIYYLLDNGLPQGGFVNRQLQVFCNLEDYCGRYVPDNVPVNAHGSLFGYSFDPASVMFDPDQYVLTDAANEYALWSPAVTYDANGGSFADGKACLEVLATTAKGLFEGSDYGYVVDDPADESHVTLDEGGNSITTPAGVVLANPADPTWDGRTFLGWFFEDGTEFEAALTQIKSNMTVYAKWSEPVPPASSDETAGSSSEQPVKPTRLAQTGDPLAVVLPVAVLAAAVCAGVCVFALRRARR